MRKMEVHWEHETKERGVEQETAKQNERAEREG